MEKTMVRFIFNLKMYSNSKSCIESYDIISDICHNFLVTILAKTLVTPGFPTDYALNVLKLLLVEQFCNP
jgi:hypothetical protein